MVTDGAVRSFRRMGYQALSLHSMPLTNLTMNLRSPAPVVRAFFPFGVATCFLVVTQAHAQPGTLDPSFDPLDGADNTVSAMVTRADGSVVIGGQFTSFNGSPAGGIIQLLPSGQVIPGFVVGSGLNGPVMDMVLQPDGKLIVVGLFTTYDGVATGGGLVRLLSNGSIDPGFVHPFALAIVSVAAYGWARGPGWEHGNFYANPGGSIATEWCRGALHSTPSCS